MLSGMGVDASARHRWKLPENHTLVSNSSLTNQLFSEAGSGFDSARSQDIVTKVSSVIALFNLLIRQVYELCHRNCKYGSLSPVAI